MPETIVTKSNSANRSITLPMPNILNCETLADLAKFQGEDLCVSQIKAQLTVGYRAKVRGMLEKKDDNGDFELSDEAIAKKIDPNWKPELRQVKTAEEKAMEALGALSPELRKAVLEQAKALKG